MAVKSHIRNARPAVLCIATNDALAGSAKNIGALMNARNYYFVPLRQDDARGKPTSIVADFSMLPQTVEAALAGTQLQPMFPR
jgi:dipicolinate synthase subunit B